MRRIFLIGYMGAGKTTIGRALARRMGISYIDTDSFIENRYHGRISDIFASIGEERFRDIERRVLDEVSEFEDIVISTGGGLPCFNDNMSVMNTKGTTVYLMAPVEELAARLEVGKTVRPVLKGRSGDELVDFIRENLEQRRHFYEQAQIWLDSAKMDDDRAVDVLTEQLIHLIDEH
ncbi:MAG: shikimate kinase [Tannerella sp.]|nr:shikimate kinase [Tannerella sp.]